VVRNTNWFVSKLILRRPAVRLNALTVAGLLRAAKRSSFSNISLLIIREGKSDRRAVNRVLLVGAGELLRGKVRIPSKGMIRDGIARHKKGGQYSRSACTPAMSGFLSDLHAALPAFATAREDIGAGPATRSPVL
jgi:hypothetical protein